MINIRGMIDLIHFRECWLLCPDSCLSNDNNKVSKAEESIVIHYTLLISQF